MHKNTLKMPLTLVWSVTAALLRIVNTATIPAIWFVCVCVRDISMTAFEQCLHRTVTPDERAERRSSSVFSCSAGVVYLWQVYVVVWELSSCKCCAKYILSATVTIIVDYIRSARHTADRGRESHAPVHVLADPSQRGAGGQFERIWSGEARGDLGSDPRSGERKRTSSPSPPSSSLSATERQEAQITGSSHQRRAAVQYRWSWCSFTHM